MREVKAMADLCLVVVALTVVGHGLQFDDSGVISRYTFDLE